jgi:hypothetical protein
LPAAAMRSVTEDLARWAETVEIAPTPCWAGYGVTMDNKPPSLDKLRRNLADGVRGVWLPVFNHANSYHTVGAKATWLDPAADRTAHTPPLPWNEARKHGYYLLDDAGRLTPFWEEVVRTVADHDVALFFGHATHPEIAALAELIDKLGFRRAVVDHPYSPFINLSIAQMQALAGVGITMNFTYDELSPLLGVDPKKMYDAIRAVGVEHVTLSSDAGEPLFPHTVECMRLIRGYMEAFGLSSDELYTVCTINPARIVGLKTA